MNPYAEGSCRVHLGQTVVQCTASVEEGAPPWRKGSGLGWVTAEYAMLPRSTAQRTQRERRGPGGRTSEIERLIGRSLRAALRSFDFGEYTIRIDCDVLQADGGTRTAAITGGAVALADACQWLAQRLGVPNPFRRLVSAISVGVVHDEVCLDLCYQEDRGANVDANIVKAEPDEYIEIQATAEGQSFGAAALDQLLRVANKGLEQVLDAQRRTLGL
jgi:ribonuclease PH